jgi:hypothetical protein
LVFQYCISSVLTPDNVVISTTLSVNTLSVSFGSICIGVCVPTGEPFNVTWNTAEVDVDG